MRTALMVSICLIPCGCFDPSAPADTDGGGTDPGTTGSTGVMSTATQTTPDPTTSSGPLTMTASGTTETATGPETTTGPDDETSTGPGGLDSSSGEETSSTGSNTGCGGGLFDGDWPDLGATELIDEGLNFQSVVAIDMDGDDDLDLVIADFNNAIETAGVYYYEGDGDGGFGTAQQLPGSNRYPLYVTAGAISDSTVDVLATVLTPESTFAVRRWRGNGDGTFLAPVEFPGASDFAITLADTNGDNRLDLLGNGDDGVRVRLGNAQEGFGAQQAYGGAGSLSSVKWGDFDGDDNIDALAADGEALAVLLGDGTGSFADATLYTIDGGTSRALVGDFDGDGNLDIGSARNAIVTVLPGDGDGGFGVPSELTVQGQAVASTTTDFDGDGCTDIVVLNNSDSVSTLLGRDDFAFTDQHVFTFESGSGAPYGLDTGDVDGDGIQDVLLVTAGGNLQGELLVMRSGG